MKSNTKSFYKYIASRMKAKNKASPMLNRLRDLVTKKNKNKKEKAEIFSTHFVCIFTGKICFHVSQILKVIYINLGEHNIAHSARK